MPIVAIVVYSTFEFQLTFSGTFSSERFSFSIVGNLVGLLPADKRRD